MPKHRSTPPTFVIIAIVGGLLFMLGGVITLMSPVAQVTLVGSALAYLALGLYTIYLINGRNSALAEIHEVKIDLEAQRSIDAGLRNRMAYTLRDPLTSIVGFADRMVSDVGLPFHERRKIAIEIRNGAREVEQVLADLASENEELDAQQRIDGLVLLHEEVQSVASTMPLDTTFETSLEPARAWADSAHFRQILRTIVNAARENGCKTLTLKTEQRLDKAVTTISSRDGLLPVEGIAALTGNTEAEDSTSRTYIALRSAHDAAAEMGGAIGYASAFGIGHIVVELNAAPDEVGVLQTAAPIDLGGAENENGEDHVPQPFNRKADLSFATAVDLRPERPTTSIRFA